MRVYGLMSAEGNQVLAPSDDDYTYKEKFITRNGNPALASWIPPIMEFGGDEPSSPMTDFPGGTGLSDIAISSAAWEVIRPLVGPYAEALPLAGDGVGYFILHPLGLVDCIDLERANVSRQSHLPGKPITYIAKYAFKPGSIGDRVCFRDNVTAARILITEELKTALEESSLTGYAFRYLGDAD